MTSRPHGIALSVLRGGTWLRRSSPLRHLEPLWARFQPRWDAALGWATRDRGIEVSINGDPLRLTPAYASYYATRAFEPEVHAAVTRGIAPGMSVLDVGAHVGLFTLAAALRVGPTGCVVAFDPSPETVVSLRRHVTLNGLDDRVEIVPAAGERHLPRAPREGLKHPSCTASPTSARRCRAAKVAEVLIDAHKST